MRQIYGCVGAVSLGLAAITLLAGPLVALGAGLILFAALVWLWKRAERTLFSALQARPFAAIPSKSIVMTGFETDVAALCEQARISNVRLALVESEHPNAVSIGAPQTGAVLIVTSGLLQALRRTELQAVVCHELAHIRAGERRFAAIQVALGRLMPFLAARETSAKRADRRADAVAASLIDNRQALTSALQKLERGTRAARWQGLDERSPLAQVCFIHPFAWKKNASEPATRHTLDRLAGLQSATATR